MSSMYKWAVTIYLKSGVVLKGIVKCKHDNSTDLFNGLMDTRGGDRTFTAINTEDGNGALYFAVADVSAMELRPLGEMKE